MGERDSLRDAGKSSNIQEKAATERQTERESGGWER
jgi:hypothetical protein